MKNNIVVKSLCYGNLDQTSFRGVIKMGTHLIRPKVFEFLFVMEIGPDNFKGVQLNRAIVFVEGSKDESKIR